MPQQSASNHHDSIDARSVAESDVTHARLMFRPEEPAADDSPTQFTLAAEPETFVVPIQDVVGADGTLIEDETPALNELRTHDNAPEAVTDWDGPYTIIYDELFAAPNADEPPQGLTHAVVTFHPQIPVDRRLVIPDDTWSYTVPIQDVLDENGALLEDDTAESDQLARHENAPEIVRRWGELTDWCFRITIDEFHSE
jgi:hypothetical protein